MQLVHQRGNALADRLEGFGRHLAAIAHRIDRLAAGVDQVDAAVAIIVEGRGADILVEPGQVAVGDGVERFVPDGEVHLALGDGGDLVG